MAAQVPFYHHDLGEAELASLAKVLSGSILTTGDVVSEFESRFSELTGRRHTLGLTSCTGGLHMALLALDIGPGDEVITTPMTFVATSAAIMAVGARPVFVDVEADTGNLDACKIEAAITERTRAIMPVHLYGLMCDMRRLRGIADRHGLFIIEDAAHCIEGRRDGVRPGDLSEAVAYSFYATKNMTCGEGGAICCDDETLFQRLKLLRLHGMTKTANDRFLNGYSHWDMTLLGWKYNMSNIEAALLLPQFERVQSNLAKRQRLAALYERHLGAAGIKTFATRPDTVHAHHVFPVMVPDRDLVITELQAAGFGSVVNYRAIHLLTFFREALGGRQGDFPNAERIGDQVMSLPFFPKLPEESVIATAKALQAILEKVRAEASQSRI
jgi:dTDP-4-amino-4,6-dideoxygalactose transaminase